MSSIPEKSSTEHSQNFKEQLDKDIENGNIIIDTQQNNDIKYKNQENNSEVISGGTPVAGEGLYDRELSIKNSSESKNNCFIHLFFCFGYLILIGLLLGIIAGGIAYYVFGIKYLIKNYDESNECKSSIGDYVITSLILSFVLTITQIKSSKGKGDEPELCFQILLSFVWLGIGIWGFISTKNENCDDIIDTPLWRFAHVISIIQLSIGSIVPFICLIVVLFAVLHK